MSEGTTELPLYRSGATVRAAVIADVDHALAQLTIELPDGKREMRHGNRSMFDGPRVPRSGDWYVESEHGHRSVIRADLFTAVYVPAIKAPAGRWDDLVLVQKQWAGIAGRAPVVVIREDGDER